MIEKLTLEMMQTSEFQTGIFLGVVMIAGLWYYQYIKYINLKSKIRGEEK